MVSCIFNDVFTKVDFDTISDITSFLQSIYYSIRSDRKFICRFIGDNIKLVFCSSADSVYPITLECYSTLYSRKPTIKKAADKRELLYHIHQFHPFL